MPEPLSGSGAELLAEKYLRSIGYASVHRALKAARYYPARLTERDREDLRLIDAAIAVAGPELAQALRRLVALRGRMEIRTVSSQPSSAWTRAALAARRRMPTAFTAHACQSAGAARSSTARAPIGRARSFRPICFRRTYQRPLRRCLRWRRRHIATGPQFSQRSTREEYHPRLTSPTFRRRKVET